MLNWASKNLAAVSPQIAGMKMRRRNQRGLATWAKWLIGIVVGGTILLLATCSVGGYLLYSQFKDTMDPGHAKEVAATIVDLEELPPRYEYTMGLDVFGQASFIAIQDKPSKLFLTIIKMPNKEKGMTSEKIVEQLAETGVNAVPGQTQTAGSIEVKSKGALPVAGQEMPYVMGDSFNKSTGKQAPTFVGCVLPTPEEAILICAVRNDSEEQSTSNEGVSKDEAKDNSKEEAAPEAKESPDDKSPEETSESKAEADEESDSIDLEAIKEFLSHIKAFK